MSPAATDRSRARAPSGAGGRRKRKRSTRGRKATRPWLAFLPLIAGLIAAPFAVRAASVLALSGPGALRLLFPFVVLVQAHAPASLMPEQRDTLAQWTMWAQLPVYGLIGSLAARWRSFVFALGLVAALHLAAVAAALLAS